MTILLVTDIILEKDSLSPLLFAAEISLTALCEIPNPTRFKEDQLYYYKYLLFPYPLLQVKLIQFY